MKFCFIVAQTERGMYAADLHLIRGFRELGHEVIVIETNPLAGLKKYASLAQSFLRGKRGADAVFIGYTLPHFVALIRVLTSKRVIFNAVCSQYESAVISRSLFRPVSFGGIKVFLIDFLSFHAAAKVLLESSSQIKYIHSFFLVPRRKLVLARIGADEHVFFRDASVHTLPQFTVLFRGKFLPESGINTIIRAAKLLENEGVHFLIIGHGFLYKEVHTLLDELDPSNVEMIWETLPADVLREKMLGCSLMLGQLADHPRLERTIPFKAYESLALGLPYLTARNKAVLEILVEDTTCFVVEPADPKRLAEKIIFLKSNPTLLSRVAEQGHSFFKQYLSAKVLAERCLAECF